MTELQKQTYRYPVDRSKIEAVKIELWYSNQAKFAEDCGVKAPTFITIMKSGMSGMKFLRGISELTKKCKKQRSHTYFISDTVHV